MSLWSGNLIPSIAMLPRYVFCRTFKTRYGWYCDPQMWREVKGVFYSHIWELLEKCRYGHGENTTSPTGIGWVQWAADLGKACGPLCDGSGLMHPCEHCGNYLAEQHPGDICNPCGCNSAAGQPSGEQRLVKNLVGAHHCVVAMLHRQPVEGRPGAVYFIEGPPSCFQHLTQPMHLCQFFRGWRLTTCSSSFQAARRRLCLGPIPVSLPVTCACVTGIGT